MSRADLAPPPQSARGPVLAPFGLAWAAALLLLVINDRALKGSGLLPGVVTGKLSDVAGMFVAPPVLAFLFRARTKRGLALAHVAVGVGFAAFELSSGLTAQAQAVYGAAGFTWHATYDLTDLLVLPLLAVSYHVALAASARVARVRADVGATLPRAAAVVGVLACAASEEPPPMSGTCTDCDVDGFDNTTDCNDYDATVNPGAGNCPGPNAEACDDGQDNDGNGLVDCDDDACRFACELIEGACSSATLLDPLTTTSVVGTTQGGSWTAEGSCGGADAPERIYTLETATWGTLVLDLPDDHVAYLREDCEAPSSELACASADTVDALVADLRPGKYTLVIDAFDGLAAADYDLAIQFASVCSDAQELPDGESQWLWTDAAHDFSSCGPGPDLAFVYTAPVDGTLALAADWAGAPVMLDARYGCDADESLSCSSGLSLFMTAGTSLFVTLSRPDGFADLAVPVKVSATLTPVTP